MSLRLSGSVTSNPRFGNVGIFSVGIIAFALATLQGCAPPSVTTASAREPGGVSLPPLGSLQADTAPRTERHHAMDRSASERAAARPLAARSIRPEYCQRCSAQ
jgi:hypothetical protein